MGRRGREKFNASSGSRRRTVLQIEPVSRRKENEGSHPTSRKREINPTSISGIGLLGQYAEDSDDEKGSSSDEEHVKEEDKKPSEEVQIDSKLNDFFKEIEAIGTEDSKSSEFVETSQATTVDSPSLQEPADASTVDQNVQGYVLPEPWQEVCDPSTNYIYYWNTLTNEVSWEIPQVFGPIQTATPVAEQPEQDAVLQKNTAGDSQSASKDPSTLIDEEISSEDKNNTTEAVDGETESRDVAESTIEGPTTLPPASELLPGEQDLKETDSSPSDNPPDECLGETKKDLSYPVRCDEGTKSESLSRKRERVEPIDMFEPETRDDDSSESGDEKQDPLEYWNEERVKNAVPEDIPEYAPTPENVDDLPRSLSDEDQPDAGKSTALEDEQDDDQEAMRTKRSDNENINDEENDPVVPAKKAKFEEESDHESEGDFAEKLLEEFLESKTAVGSSSDDDMDVDSDEQQDPKEDAPLLPPEAFIRNQADKLTEDSGASPADVSRSQVEVDTKAEKETEKLTTEIHDLCQLLSNKLEFLNINKDGVNKLLVVLIQIETRIKDWREGGLSSTYMVKKLREAAQELEKYEQSAVPKGWSCHWDRYCISLNTTSMSRTTFLPSEIFQVKERPPFWIGEKLSFGRDWEVFYFLTFQLFVNFVLRFKLLYEEFWKEFPPLSCQEIERFYDSTSKTKRMIFYIRHSLITCVTNSPVGAFMKQKTVDVYSSVSLYRLSKEIYILILSTSNRKVFKSFIYSPVYAPEIVFCFLMHANYANYQFPQLTFHSQGIANQKSYFKFILFASSFSNAAKIYTLNLAN